MENNALLRSEGPLGDGNGPPDAERAATLSIQSRPVGSLPG